MKLEKIENLLCSDALHQSLCVCVCGVCVGGGVVEANYVPEIKTRSPHIFILLQSQWNLAVQLWTF